MPKIYCIILKHFWHFLSEKLKPTTNLQSTITPRICRIWVGAVFQAQTKMSARYDCYGCDLL